MMYLRLYSRGRWSKVHTMSNAAIRTHCGHMVDSFQCVVEISHKQPEGELCKWCVNEVTRRGETAER